jgi:putative membrane protein
VPVSLPFTMPRRPATMTPDEIAGPAAILMAGAGLAWLSGAHPTWAPVWAPWDFNWSQFLACTLSVWWYARGVALLPAAERPGIARQGAFLLGVALIYAVLLTRFEYAAQHMFFLNRVQHLAMHHLGPFLIALAWPGAALARGMPAPLLRLTRTRAVRRVMHTVQQPALAAVLFAGLIGLWLIPAVHFRAMLDPRLYDVMNWSMVLDGVLFWCLVLDPRPAPPARTGYGVRLSVTAAVMLPQIVLGAVITFTTQALYPSYDLCGRLMPSIGALLDQHIGGSIIWIPGAMMSSFAFLLIINNVRLDEERRAATEIPNEDANDDAGTVFASGWTGR